MLVIINKIIYISLNIREQLIINNKGKQSIPLEKMANKACRPTKENNCSSEFNSVGRNNA